MANETRVLSKLKTLLSNHEKCVGIRVTNVTGMPDTLACVNGRFVGIEVKWDKNGSYGLRKSQKVRLRHILAAGGVACVVDKNNINEFEKLLDKLCESDIVEPLLWGVTEGELS